MRIAMPLKLIDPASSIVDEIIDLERAGLDEVYVPEAYGYDAVSQLGYLAARTETIGLASGILQIYTRTPSLTAMTAATIDTLSGGRFRLGLGASGPQVVEGFHGVRFDAPVARTREIVEICRSVWRRERVEHAGPHYQLPLPAGLGTGLGKPLKITNTPVRERVPILIAAVGPRNVELTAEIAEGWEPIFYLPEKAKEVWGDALARGLAKRDSACGDLDVIAQLPLAIGEDVAALRDLARPTLALYIGGMGARSRNFYNDLACRYGYADAARHIQDLYLAGRKAEAEAAVPDELVDLTSLVGPASHVRERIAAFAEAGVTTLNVTPYAPDRAGRLAQITQLIALCG